MDQWHRGKLAKFARTRDWTGLVLEPTRMDHHTLSGSQSVAGGQAESSQTVVKWITHRLTTRWTRRLLETECATELNKTNSNSCISQHMS